MKTVKRKQRGKRVTTICTTTVLGKNRTGDAAALLAGETSDGDRVRSSSSACACEIPSTSRTVYTIADAMRIRRKSFLEPWRPSKIRSNYRRARAVLYYVFFFLLSFEAEIEIFCRVHGFVREKLSRLSNRLWIYLYEYLLYGYLYNSPVFNRLFVFFNTRSHRALCKTRVVRGKIHTLKITCSFWKNRLYRPKEKKTLIKTFVLNSLVVYVKSFVTC